MVRETSAAHRAPAKRTVGNGDQRDSDFDEDDSHGFSSDFGCDSLFPSDGGGAGNGPVGGSEPEGTLG